jgi:hypothetical protein
MIKKMASAVRAWLTWPLVQILEAQHDAILRAEWYRSKEAARNPLARFGAKYFSQGDEDGIMLEIARRLDIKNGTFAELGVGNGLENNTLILLASGWRGIWIGAEDLAFNHKVNPKRLSFHKAWVSLNNVTTLLKDGLDGFGIESLDVLSLDLDGNDYYLAKEILTAGISAKLIVLEYNAKFPPPIKWTIKYDQNHLWDETDYQGVSLALLAELLSEFSYTLVCCNAATGANAFFVKNEYLSLFSDVPKSIDDIFVECRYQVYRRWGHQPSPRTIERILETSVDC